VSDSLSWPCVTGFTSTHPDANAGRAAACLLAERSWQRQAYRIEELKRWRIRLGVHLNIERKFFPSVVDLASCLVIAGQQRGLPVADSDERSDASVWSEDQDVSDPKVLVANAGREGINGAALLEDARSEAVRAEYQGNTSRAVAAGYLGRRFTCLRASYFGVRTVSTCWKKRS
jgi:2-hydroxychromene-2-carboxylate isomerase